MKKHLTELSVERIRPPKQGTVEIFDLGYPGLALRIGHGGAKTFEQFYRHGGKLRRDTIGRWPAISLADARMAWRKTREAIAKGEASISWRKGSCDGVRDRRRRMDAARSVEEQGIVAIPSPRSLEVDLLPAWRGRRVDEISKRDVHDLLDSIADRGAPVMARRVQAYVNRFFAWCIERDILKVDPTAGMARVGNGKSRERV